MVRKIDKEYMDYLRLFRSRRFKYPLRHIFQKRLFHAFCLGTPKSGTHSIANLLSGYRTSHEPDEIFMIGLISKRMDNEILKHDFTKIMSYRDTFNWLEMESSHYNGFFVDELSALFEQAKFILTIRDGISWVDSWFNHQLSRPMLLDKSIYNIGRSNYYSRGFSYTKYDSFMESMKLFPIKSYLQFWNEHNYRILNSVQPEKLLILKTNEISDSAEKLAEFLEIAESTINTKESHGFKAKGKHEVLKKIDSGYLYDCAMETCGELNDRIFPEKTIKFSINELRGSKNN